MRISDWSSDVCSSDLEVRRAFHGPVLDFGGTGDGELLAYSLAWLGYAWLLLGLGIGTGYASLRYASLAVLAVATGKVLLFDWGTLEGLPRFFSFAALGFSLLGIPLLYQRLVFRSEEHTSELQSLMRISYAVFCLQK